MVGGVITAGALGLLGTCPVAFDSAEALPWAFLAVTWNLSVCPWSAFTIVYEVSCAPLIGLQPTALSLHRSHWYAYVIGWSPFQLPGFPVSLAPTMGATFDEMNGSCALLGWAWLRPVALDATRSATIAATPARARPSLGMRSTDRSSFVSTGSQDDDLPGTRRRSRRLAQGKDGPAA